MNIRVCEWRLWESARERISRFHFSPSLERFENTPVRLKKGKTKKNLDVGEDRERCFRENKTEVFGWARDQKEEKEIFLDFSSKGKNKQKSSNNWNAILILAHVFKTLNTHLQ